MIVGIGEAVMIGATVPAAMTSEQWTLTNPPTVGGDQLTVDIDAAPSDGGSALLRYEFKVDPGTWQTLPGGTALGTRQITVLLGALASVQLRAVNAIGAANPSDTKSETPAQTAGPTNTVAPALSGIFAVGETITVSNGTWSVTPDEYERRWTYGSTLLSGETGSTYVVDDFTFGQNLFAEVRCRQTGGAWSSWITATGADTVAADPQDVIWATETTSYSGDNPRTFTTPAVSAGDMIVLMAKCTTSSLTQTFEQADFNIGTMRFASDFNNGECIALVTYVCPTTEAGGLSFSVGHGDSGVEIHSIIVNIGPHVFSAASGTSDEGSSLYNFATPTAPRNAKVFWGQGHRNGGISFTASPTTPSKSTSPPYAAGGNFDSGDSSTFLYFIRTQASPGTVASQSMTPSGYTTRKHVVATFTPQIVAPSVPDGKYVADDNGAGIARTSTISSMVTDGVTLTLASSRKVGNYISNNLGLGTLFIYDAGAGVTINSHTGTAAWKNPTAIVDGTNSQPFVNESGMTGPPYSAGLAASFPLSLAAGDTLLISVNQSPAINSSYVSKYVTVHVVGTIPYDDEFAPPLVWDASLGAKPRFRFSDWNQGTKPLPTMTAEANAPSLATVQQTYNRRFVDLVNTWNNYSIAATLHQPLYGRDTMIWEKDALAVLCANYTLEQKKPILVGLLQRGIDVYGVYASGKAQTPSSIWYSANGGHKASRKFPIVFAGHLLGNNAMRDIDSTAAVNEFQEDGMTTYITQTIIDYTQAGGWAGGEQVPSGSGSEAYVQGMLDGQSLNYPMPEWCGRIYDPTYTSANFNAHWNGHAYRFTGNANDSTSEVLLAAAMGLDAYWGNDAWFDYQRRHYEMRRNGVDPWRLAGGGTNRYPMVNTTGASAHFNIGAPSSTSTGWAERMYAANINTVWPYPW